MLTVRQIVCVETSVRLDQVRMGAVVAAGTLPCDLALQSLDKTVFLLQLFS